MFRSVLVWMYYILVFSLYFDLKAFMKIKLRISSWKGETLSINKQKQKVIVKLRREGFHQIQLNFSHSRLLCNWNFHKDRDGDYPKH